MLWGVKFGGGGVCVEKTEGRYTFINDMNGIFVGNYATTCVCAWPHSPISICVCVGRVENVFFLNSLR